MSQSSRELESKCYGESDKIYRLSERSSPTRLTAGNFGTKGKMRNLLFPRTKRRYYFHDGLSN